MSNATPTTAAIIPTLAGEAANENRASAGYTAQMLLAMLASIGDSNLYWNVGTANHATEICYRRNDHHAAQRSALLAARDIYRAAGMRTRVRKHLGHIDTVIVYGPKVGGVAGRYSA